MGGNMAGTAHHLLSTPTTSLAWWSLSLGVAALLIGPFWGFGFLGLLLAIATLITTVIAYRHGERSWIMWLGLAIALAVAAYVPFMPSQYPYTNP